MGRKTSEKEKEWSKKYRTKNRKLLQEKRKQWITRNPDKRKLYNENRAKAVKIRKLNDPEFRKKQSKSYRDRYRNKIKNSLRQPNLKYSNIKSKAKSRGLEFSITLEEYTKLISGSKCYYCKVSVESSPGGSLDRINNETGYNINNVLPCCGTCNRMRNNFVTVEEFKVMMDSLLVFRNKQ